MTNIDPALAARDALPDGERRELDAMTHQFAAELKKRCASVPFGVQSGAELWWRLGALLNEKEAGIDEKPD